MATVEMKTSSEAVQDLLEQQARLAEAKQEKITGLLAERVELARTTQERLAGIASELKALGWHHPRTAKAKTPAAGA